MADAAHEAYRELGLIFSRLTAVLHDIYAVAEFAEDKHAVIGLAMVGQGQGLVEQAEELADTAYNVRGKKRETTETH
jgi:hypothetical protein